MDTLDTGSGAADEKAAGGGPPDTADWSTITRIGEVPRSKDGDLVEGYRLFLVTGRDGATPAAVMPRP